MNRFLTSATAMVLGLALSGIANADGRNDQRSNHERFECDRTADCNRGSLRYFDAWRLESYWDALRYLHQWWFGRDFDDLRHFDHFDRGNYYCFDDGHITNSGVLTPRVMEMEP
jgi:hypothetical protein